MRKSNELLLETEEVRNLSRVMKDFRSELLESLINFLSKLIRVPSQPLKKQIENEVIRE